MATLTVAPPRPQETTSARDRDRMLELTALGRPVLVDSDGRPLSELTRQPKLFAVLIYLACGERCLLRRDDLLAMFWRESEETAARNCLRQSLHLLRKQLGRGVVVGDGDQEIGIDPAALLTDVKTFERSLKAGTPEVALELHRGAFLDGFLVRDVPGFESWVEGRRSALAAAAVNAAKQLAHAAEGREDVPGALHWWGRAADLVPFDEFLVRRIASLLALSGNRGEALVTLARFQERLRAELEVDLSDQTRALRSALRNGHDQDALRRGLGDRRRPKPARRPSHWRRATDHFSLQSGYPGSRWPSEK